MKRLLRGESAWTSFLLAAALFAVVLTFFDCIYLENDNTRIELSIRSGSHIRFIGYFWARIIGGLYGVAPDVPWYGVGLYLVCFLSLFLALEFLRRVRGDGRPLWGAIIPCLLLYVGYVMHVSYSMTSMLVGGGAFLCGLLVLREERPRWVVPVLLGLFFSLSFEVRSKGALGVLAFTFPVALLALFRAGPRVWRTLALAALPCVTLYVADGVFFRRSLDPAFEKYDDFDRVRGRLHSYPQLNLSKNDSAVLAAARWNPTDMELFKRWFFIDEDKFNVESLTALKEAANPDYVTPDRILSRALTLGDYVWYIALLLLLPCIGLTARGRGTFTWMALYSAYVLGLIMYMKLYQRFPTRVGLPLANAALGCQLFLLFTGGTLADKRLRRVLGAVAVLVATVGSSVALVAVVEESSDAHELFQSDLDTLRAGGPESIFVFQSGAGMRWDRANPLRQYELGFHPIRCGWNTFSPDFYRSLEPLGVTRGKEVLPALVGHEHAYFVAQPPFVQFLARFAIEQYGLQVNFTPVGSLSTGAFIYRLTDWQ